MFKANLLVLTCVLVSTTAFADGDCTPRKVTAAEQKLFGEAYALFVKAAPKAPPGWQATDAPSSGVLKEMCEGLTINDIRFVFNRDFERVEGQKERQEKAVSSYTDQSKRLQALQEKNKAKIAEIDAKIEANGKKIGELATAQKFAELEAISKSNEELMKEKMRLSGLDGVDAENEKINAVEKRDTQARFALTWEAPLTEPRGGGAYPTTAGKARLSAVEDKGMALHEVTIDFDSKQARHPVILVQGDPKRVRGLIDASDLKAIAAQNISIPASR